MMLRKHGGNTLIAVAAGLLAACAGDRDDLPAEQQRFVELREGPDRLEPPAMIAKPEIRPQIVIGPVATRINDTGLSIIKSSEGLRLDAYQLAGQWLIGYGHAALAAEGMKITEDEAEYLLRKDIADVERGLQAMLPIPLTDDEFSALVALAYNLGLGGFERSLVFQRLLAGDRAGAADAFLYLDSAVVDGERRELPSLIERRQRERELFLSGNPPEENAALMQAGARAVAEARDIEYFNVDAQSAAEPEEATEVADNR